MKEKKMMWIRYAICFGVVAVLCYLFPYTGDDWAWGSQIGIDRLNQWFENYNGRYVGNLIVLVMTRSNLLKAVIMSVGLTGIVALSEYIFKREMGILCKLCCVGFDAKTDFKASSCMDGWICKLCYIIVSYFAVYCLCDSCFPK